MAVVAVHAHAVGVLGSEGAQNGVVPLLGGGAAEAQNPLEVLPVPHAGKHRQNTGLVQSVLDALVLCQRLAEGRGLRFQQLPAAESLHHRDAHALCLAAAVQRLALVHLADGVLALLVIVAGVDAEHHHVQDAQIQRLLHHGRRVRGKPHVADHPLLF